MVGLLRQGIAPTGAIGLLTRSAPPVVWRHTVVPDVVDRRGCALQNPNLQALREALSRGIRHPDVVASFVILSLLQGILSIVAWFTSSGYEDSLIPYILQAVIGVLQIGAIGWIAWKARQG